MKRIPLAARRDDVDGARRRLAIGTMLTVTAWLVAEGLIPTAHAQNPSPEVQKIIDSFDEEQDVIRKIVRYNFDCLSFGALNILSHIKPWITIMAGVALIVCLGAVAFGATRGIDLSRVAQIALCIAIADGALYIASSLLDPDGANQVTLMAAKGVTGAAGGVGAGTQICEAWQ